MIEDDANIGITKGFCLYLEEEIYKLILCILDAPTRDVQKKLNQLEEYINSGVPKIQKHNYTKKHLSIKEILI